MRRKGNRYRLRSRTSGLSGNQQLSVTGPVRSRQPPPALHARDRKRGASSPNASRSSNNKRTKTETAESEAEWIDYNGEGNLFMRDDAASKEDMIPSVSSPILATQWPMLTKPTRSAAHRYQAGPLARQVKAARAFCRTAKRLQQGKPEGRSKTSRLGSKFVVSELNLKRDSAEASRNTLLSKYDGISHQGPETGYWYMPGMRAQTHAVPSWGQPGQRSSSSCLLSSEINYVLEMCEFYPLISQPRLSVTLHETNTFILHKPNLPLMIVRCRVTVTVFRLNQYFPATTASYCDKRFRHHSNSLRNCCSCPRSSTRRVCVPCHPHTSSTSCLAGQHPLQ